MDSQTSSTASSLSPRTAAIVEGSISHAFCMAIARAYTNFNPSSNDRAFEATKAENSPNE